MAKLTATQQVIVNAFASYKEGSTAVVRAFEEAIRGFWYTDSCNPTNLAFFVNTAKRFPRLQQVVIGLLKKQGDDALAYLDFKKDKTTGEYILTNKEGITKEMKVKARQNVAAFIANEYTSLMHEKSIKMEIKFDAGKAATSIKGSITNQLKALLSENQDADIAILKKIVDDAVAAAFEDKNIAKVKANVIVEKAA